MKRTLLLLSSCCLLLSGCGDSASRDASDEKNPRIKRGLDLVQMKRWDEALEQFEEALQKDSTFARPDLELALIYHQQKKDYVRAIYHYQRYLEKRPESEKKPFISDWIRQAKVSLAADVGQSSGKISKEIIRLTRENNLLRKQLDEKLEAGTSTASAPPTSNPELLDLVIKKVEAIPKPEPIVAAPAPVEKTADIITTPKTYTVKSGDSLSKIARSLYGKSSEWKKIYAANRDTMKNEHDLSVGQTLIIPTASN